MKKVFFLAVLSLCFFSCEKTTSQRGEGKAELQIIQTNTPAAVPKGGEIVSTVRCQGPNLCYSFSHFQVTEAGTRISDVRAKAHLPNYSGALVCAEAIYHVDTILRVPAPNAGTYLLRFYNGQQLFKSDTVQVN